MPVFDKALLKTVWRASAIGWFFVLATAAGYFMGKGVDYAMEKWFGWHTKPVFMVIFLILGIVAGFLELFKIAQSMRNESDKNESDKKDL